MRKSVFWKYFCIITSVLLGSFILLTVVIVSFSQSLWVNQKYSVLSNTVKTISDYSTPVLENNFNYKSEMSTTINIGSHVIDADIYVVDSSGKIFITSESTSPDVYTSKQIGKEIIEETMKEEYVSKSTMGGLFTTNKYTVGYPIKCNGKAIGAVFASARMDESVGYGTRLYRLIFLCSFIVLIISTLVTYIITTRVTNPLKAMAKAAREIEKGNCDQNIMVKSHDEVGMLAEAFNKMSKSVGSLESMRRSFISSVSHELKTPMTTISGFIDGILDGTIAPENQQKYLEIVSDETKRLSRLVNSMLQLSRLENNNMKLNISEFNITDMIIQILFSFETAINNKNIDIKGLDTAEQAELKADRDLIYQVMYNIIENAIKFTPQDGYISVSVAKTRYETVKIAIQNSGEGLTEQELSKIFERFYKTDRSRSMDKTGMGFGLYMVKMIVGLHEGQIVASSVKNNYTRFETTLPLHSHGNNERS